MAGLRERFPPRRIARLIGWNALVLFVLLALAAGGAEVYLRLTGPPFIGVNVLPVRMVPGVGVIRPPHAEIRYTNGEEFWQVSRANSLGFLDREPPDPARAAESCHVTLIGDSFVEAREVPIADKAQVRLEELAALEAPELDVTTSAFGYQGTAQINQLAFYDRFARPLSPDVVVLVATRNDLPGNSLPLTAWEHGFHPDHPPWFYARRGPGGEMEFVPPAASLEELRAHLLPPVSAPGRTERTLRGWSYLADWLWSEVAADGPFGIRRTNPSAEERLARAETISRHPRHTAFTHGWSASRPRDDLLLAENPPPVFREALDVMGFALEQFRQRAQRDGAALVILATYRFGGDEDPKMEWLRELAGGGIPVLNQRHRVKDVGGRIGEARWEHDIHWTPAGHRWVAEAILEWLKANPEVCD